MSADERAELREHSTADTVAGFLAAGALAAGVLALVYYPGRVGPASMLVALIAAGLGTGAHRRLAALALGTAGVCWILGMAIAVLTDRSIF